LRGGIAIAVGNRLIAAVTWRSFFPVWLPLLLVAGCAAPRDGADDSWSRRASDFLDPLLPDSLTLGRREPPWQTAVRLDPADFRLEDRREVRVVFSVRNTTRRSKRLEFPSAQRIELAVLAPDGRRIFLWSEDRLFDPRPATVVINPRERVEYEASVPTRDMTAGGVYLAEVGLVGYPEVTGTAKITPR
jgi:hypothetical protein